MFRIRPEQMEAFAAAQREQFEDEIAKEMRELYGQELADVGDAELRARVHRAVDRAKGYGLDDEEEAAAFVELTVELGEHFDTDPDYPWARAILRDPRLDAEQKIEALRAEADELEDVEED